MLELDYWPPSPKVNFDMASLKRLSFGRLTVDSSRLFQCGRVEVGAVEFCFGNWSMIRKLVRIGGFRSCWMPTRP